MYRCASWLQPPIFPSRGFPTYSSAVPEYYQGSFSVYLKSYRAEQVQAQQILDHIQEPLTDQSTGWRYVLTD